MTMPRSPATTFGALFAAVQAGRLFDDSKTFADAVPRRAIDAILSDWRRAPPAGPALRDFVEANFRLPGPVPTPALPPLPLDAHIDRVWTVLTRRSTAGDEGSELALPHAHVVPGGRFRELYYWDSYFTMLGLVRSGRQDLVENMIADFGSLIDRFGHIPNGTRSYYLSRSHPPFFYLMAALSLDQSIDARRRRLRWMQAEHAYWMDGAAGLARGGAHRRAVRLADGALLNRYWDDLDTPRDESWREDMALATVAAQPATLLWRNLRAAAESGWDFSSRWFADGSKLESIRTTQVIPIDLNCLLHGLETRIATEAAALADQGVAITFGAHARQRAQAIADHLWCAAGGFYADYDLDTGRSRGVLTAATAFPLFTGVADPRRAESTVDALRTLVRPGGLMTTLCPTGQQWDAPNGWAPLQWIAITGLRNYGAEALAAEIARNWLTMVERCFDATGQLYEKYDVERCCPGGGGEYGTEVGFGWTNGVVRALRA